MDQDPPTAIIPIDLGVAATFDQRIFPLAYYDEGSNIGKGSLLIRATLEEMARIKQLGIDLNKNEEFIFDTRVQLETLKAEKARLQGNSRTFNPFKAFRNYRAARLFHEGSKTLYLQTKRTSEKIHREERLQVVSSTQMRMVNDPIPPDARIGGVAISLPCGLNEEAERTINEAKKTIATADPFQDNSLIPQLGNDEQQVSLAYTESVLSQDVPGSNADGSNRSYTSPGDPLHSPPTSPQAINFIQIINPIMATNSDLTGVNQVSRDSVGGQHHDNFL